MITFAVVTVSDTCSAGESEDTSGPAIASWCNSNILFDGSVNFRDCIADDKDLIKTILIDICDNGKSDVIITTGGTGFSPRDVTPEVTKSILDKEAPGIVAAMLMGSLKITPMAMLSRQSCGIRGKTLVINLPGSKKAAIECLEIIGLAIRHAVDLIKDSEESIRAVHRDVQSEGGDVGNKSSAGFRQPQQGHVCSHNFQQGPVGDGGDLEKVAHRLRVSPYAVTPLEEALNAVLSYSHVTDVERISYNECNGRILAEDIIASDPLPPFPASIKDGYAVIAADGIGVRTVLGNSTAGSNPEAVQVSPGNCVRINTGAPVPPGADSVVQVEDTKLVSSDAEGTVELEIEILVAPHVKKDIRAIGSDIAQGQKVLSRGSKMGYSELGVLAAVGVTEVAVYRMPLVGILSTGNELVEPGSPLAPGKIRDSNRTVLKALFKEHNFPTVDLGIAEDNVDSLVSKLKYGFETADILVSSGGVSMGDKDILKPVLKGYFSAKLHFGRVFLKPGLPTTFATVLIGDKTKLLFALPGNPVSAAVTSNLFVIPALRKMSGHSNPLLTVIKAKVASTIQLDPRPEFQRVVLTWNGNSEVPLAEVTGNQISSRLLSMSSANGLLVLPPKSEKITRVEADQIIDCIVIGRI